MSRIRNFAIVCVLCKNDGKYVIGGLNMYANERQFNVKQIIFCFQRSLRPACIVGAIFEWGCNAFIRFFQLNIAFGDKTQIVIAKL